MGCVRPRKIMKGNITQINKRSCESGRGGKRVAFCYKDREWIGWQSVFSLLNQVSVRTQSATSAITFCAVVFLTD